MRKALYDRLLGSMANFNTYVWRLLNFVNLATARSAKRER